MLVLKPKVRVVGFTLVELLVVILIICILVAALMPVYGLILKRSKIESTTARIAGLSAALESYREKFDCYPPTPANSNEDDGTLYDYLNGKDGRGIISDPNTPRQKFYPPLLSFGKESYRYENDRFIIIDAWNVPIHYFNCKEYVDGGKSAENCHKPDKFDIWSYGPNKKQDPDLQEPGTTPVNSKTEVVIDDITNWGARVQGTTPTDTK